LHFWLRIDDDAMNKAVCLTIVLGAMAGVVSAQEAGPERDPFFSAGPRSSLTAPAEQGGEWGRDPFARPFDGAAAAVPQIQQPAPAPEFKLTGIIYNDTVRIAVINGEMVGEGGMVGGRKVLKVRNSSVVLANGPAGSQEFFLENFSIR
jgi:hypothetical protein